MTSETLMQTETETANLILMNQNLNLMMMTTMMTNCGNLVNLSCCYWRWNAYAVSGT
jgi:hypothetical protein